MSPERRDFAPYEGGRRLLWGALLAAAVGAGMLAVAFVVDPRRAFFGYLAGYAYAVSFALGALAFLLIVSTMNATWPVALRRLNEAIAGTLPLFLPLFLPIVAGLGALYPWTDPAAIGDAHLRALVVHKHAFLNPPFFVARAAFYLLAWGALSTLLRRWSLAQDADSPSPERWKMRARVLSAVALPPLGLTLTFASIDWLMSLSPAWQSTMFGLSFFAGSALAGLAALVLATLFVQREGFLPEVRAAHYYALGRLLLTFVVLWAYLAFFQFLLIWIADKPDETPYYIARIHTSWRSETVALVVLQFAAPFLLLLPFRPKRSGRFLFAIALWLAVAHYLDVHWLVVPSGYPAGFTVHLGDLGGALFPGGLAVAFAVWLLRGHPLVPRNDPALPRALEYRSR